MKSVKKYLLTDLLYLKIFIAFSAGIFIAEVFSGAFWLGLLPFLLFGLFQIIYFFIGVKRSKVIDSAVFSAIFFCGIISHSIHFYLEKSSLIHLADFYNKKSMHIVRIDDQPILKPNSIQLEGTLLYSIKDAYCKKSKQKILLYLPKETVAKQYEYGQIIQVKGQILRPARINYPFEFDYAKWLGRRHIFATLYSREFKTIGMDNDYFYQVSKLPYRLRDYFENEIDKAISDKESNGIAKSILIGTKTELDKDLYSAYAETGTIHILSISGLHFGILILFLDYLLSFFIKRESHRLTIKHTISFFYALVTGFSAPIMRSFIMFLFFDIAKWKGWRVNPFNILFLSAWLILLFDTQQLFNIGYQFSYSALMGIMLIYQRAIWKVQFSGAIPNFIWKSFVTLMAAWIFTIPLTIFYFHKMSLIGSLSNIIVVPLATLIMYIGFVFLLVSKVSLLGSFLGLLLSWLITVQNKIIFSFSQLPYSSLSTNLLDGIGLMFIFVLIGAMLIFLYTKTIMSLRFSLVTLCIFVFYSSFHEYQLMQETKWFLYSNNKHTALVYKGKKNIYVFADSVDKGMNNFFLKSISSYYQSKITLYKGKTYFKNISNLYSMNYRAQPRHIILCRENQSHWDRCLNEGESFILMKNLGSGKPNLIEKLTLLKKKYHVF